MVFLKINSSGLADEKLMKIFYQTNNNGCGIAITRSIIYHFYKKEISEEELYDNCNIGKYGISIADLEKLNKKYGIQLESYRMDFEEFRAYKTKDYFILIVRKPLGHHYTIGKKNEKYVTLYDPGEGKIQMTYGQISEIFTGIFIKIKKNDSAPLINQFRKTIKEFEINWMHIRNLLCINILVLIFSVSCDFCIKLIFSEIGEKVEFSNLIKIIWISIVFYGAYHVGELLEIYIISDHKNKYSKSLCQSLISSLSRKKNNYFNKLGDGQFLLLKEHIENIADFISEYINSWITGLITLGTIGAILIYSNLLFALIIPITLSIQYIFWLLHKKIYEKYFGVINEVNNESRKHLISIKNFLQREINNEKIKKLGREFLKIYEKQSDLNKKFTQKHHSVSKCQNLTNNVAYILILLSISYLIFFKNAKYEELIFLSILYRKITTCFGTLINFSTCKYKFKYSKQIYNQMIQIGNIENTRKINLPEVIKIKNLTYGVPGKIIFRNLNLTIPKFTLIYGASGCGKSMLYNLISQKIECDNSKIYFDQINLNNIGDELHEIFVYQTNNSYLGEEKYEEIIKDIPVEIEETVNNMFKKMNLKVGVIYEENNLSSGQRQFINILKLFRFKEKILLLDEVASNINFENKLEIFRSIIAKLADENFVICSEHCGELIELFPHSINLEKISEQ